MEKWYLMQFFPISAVLLSAVMIIASRIWSAVRRWWIGCRSRSHPHVSTVRSDSDEKLEPQTPQHNGSKGTVGVTSKSVVHPTKTRSATKSRGAVVATNGCIALLDVLYLALVKKALEVHRCIDVDTERRLAADASVVCSGPAYDRLVSASYYSVIVYGFGTPVLFIVILLRCRYAIIAEQAYRSQGVKLNPFSTIRRRFKRLYNKFTPECYYWSLVIMVRKGVLVFVGFYFNADPVFAASVTATTLLVAQVLQSAQHPYRVKAISQDIQQLGTVRITLGSAFRRVVSMRSYLEDFNALESTYLNGSVMILLCGVSYGVAKLPSSHIGPATVTVLELVMVGVVVITTCVCLFSVLTEQFRSIQVVT